MAPARCLRFAARPRSGPLKFSSPHTCACSDFSLCSWKVYQCDIWWQCHAMSATCEFGPRVKERKYPLRTWLDHFCYYGCSDLVFIFVEGSIFLTSNDTNVSSDATNLTCLLFGVAGPVAVETCSPRLHCWVCGACSRCNRPYGGRAHVLGRCWRLGFSSPCCFLGCCAIHGGIHGPAAAAPPRPRLSQLRSLPPPPPKHGTATTHRLEPAPLLRDGLDHHWPLYPHLFSSPASAFGALLPVLLVPIATARPRHHRHYSHLRRLLGVRDTRTGNCQRNVLFLLRVLAATSGAVLLPMSLLSHANGLRTGRKTWRAWRPVSKRENMFAWAWRFSLHSRQSLAAPVLRPSAGTVVAPVVARTNCAGGRQSLFPSEITPALVCSPMQARSACPLAVGRLRASRMCPTSLPRLQSSAHPKRSRRILPILPDCMAPALARLPNALWIRTATATNTRSRWADDRMLLQSSLRAYAARPFLAQASFPHSTLWPPHSALYAPRFTLQTLHSALYTPHLTLHTLHPTLYTPHFALYPQHFTLHTSHFTLNALHSTLYTPHFTLLTLYFTLYTPHFTLHSLVSMKTLLTLYSTLYTPHFTLHSCMSILCTPRFVLHTPHSTLHTFDSTLSPPRCTLQSLHSTLCALHLPLHTLHFTLPTFDSTLYTLHSTLYTLHSTLPTLDSTLNITLRTLHSTLYTLHFRLHTLHFALHTWHCTLPTPHSGLSTLPFTLHTFHSTLCTPTLHNTLHSTLYTSPFYTPHFPLYTLHSALYTPHFPLHTFHSTLGTCTPHSTLYTPHSTLQSHSLHLTLSALTLYTPHFILHILHSTLYTWIEKTNPCSGFSLFRRLRTVCWAPDRPLFRALLVQEMPGVGGRGGQPLNIYIYIYKGWFSLC